MCELYFDPNYMIEVKIINKELQRAPLGMYNVHIPGEPSPEPGGDAIINKNGNSIELINDRPFIIRGVYDIEEGVGSVILGSKLIQYTERLYDFVLNLELRDIRDKESLAPNKMGLEGGKN